MKSRIEWLVLIVLFGVVAGTMWYSKTAANERGPTGTYAVDVEVTRHRVEQLGQRLADADAKGDAGAAAAMFDILTASLRPLNDSPRGESAPLRDCRTALMHVTKGAIAVSEGGRWDSADQYRAALNDCR